MSPDVHANGKVEDGDKDLTNLSAGEESRRAGRDPIRVFITELRGMRADPSVDTESLKSALVKKNSVICCGQPISVSWSRGGSESVTDIIQFLAMTAQGIAICSVKHHYYASNDPVYVQAQEKEIERGQVVDNAQVMFRLEEKMGVIQGAIKGAGTYKELALRSGVNILEVKRDLEKGKKELGL